VCKPRDARLLLEAIRLMGDVRQTRYAVVLKRALLRDASRQRKLVRLGERSWGAGGLTRDSVLKGSRGRLETDIILLQASRFSEAAPPGPSLSACDCLREK
jgi:hypothetical protein